MIVVPALFLCLGAAECPVHWCQDLSRNMRWTSARRVYSEWFQLQGMEDAQ